MILNFLDQVRLVFCCIRKALRRTEMLLDCSRKMCYFTARVTWQNSAGGSTIQGHRRCQWSLRLYWNRLWTRSTPPLELSVGPADHSSALEVHTHFNRAMGQGAGGGEKFDKINHTCTVLWIIDVSMLHRLRRWLWLYYLQFKSSTLAPSEV